MTDTGNRSIGEKRGFVLLKEGLPLDLISRHRNTLFGIAIIWIVIYHSFYFGTWLGVLGKRNLVNLLVLYGEVGVDIFLLLSGMGLYFSFKKNEQIIPFIKRRLIRVLPPFFIIWGIVWGVRFLAITPNFSAFLQRILLMRFWLKNDTQVWYVNFVLCLYLLYPFVYHYLFDKGHSLMRVLIAMGGAFIFSLAMMYAYPSFSQSIMLALARLPIALFGCYLGKLIYEKRKLPAFWSLIMLVGACLAFYLRYWWVPQNPFNNFWALSMLGVGGFFFVYVFAIFLELLGEGRLSKVVTKIFSFFGWMSLELYFSSVVMKLIYTLYFMKGSGRISEYFVFMAVAVVIAVVVRFMLDKVPRIFRKINFRYANVG